MAENQNRTLEPFRLYSSSANNINSGFGFFDSPELLLPPPPPSLEVFSSEASSSVKYTVEPVNLDGLTLLKGRVSTREVFALSNSDLVPGKYEGGLKLWEGSLDLVKALRSEVGNEKLAFTGKQVLELGCGHGLPGIFACLEGAASVHFQDFNAEVLKCLTIPNVNANLQKKFQPSKIDVTNSETVTEVRFFAGDWSEIDRLLPHVRDSRKESDLSSGNCSVHGYDIVLMAETVYSVTVFQRLYELIKKCLSYPHGLVYMAAKKHYFGVGGGTRQFLSMVEKDGLMAFSMVAEVADGSSNVREVWKLSFNLIRREALVYNTPEDHVTRDFREGIAKLGDLRFRVLDSAGLETAASSDSILDRMAGMTANVLGRSQFAIFLIDVWLWNLESLLLVG